jgi:hypothetical protein
MNNGRGIKADSPNKILDVICGKYEKEKKKVGNVLKTQGEEGKIMGKI